MTNENTKNAVAGLIDFATAEDRLVAIRNKREAWTRSTVNTYNDELWSVIYDCFVLCRDVRRLGTADQQTLKIQIADMVFDKVSQFDNSEPDIKTNKVTETSSLTQLVRDYVFVGSGHLSKDQKSTYKRTLDKAFAKDTDWDTLYRSCYGEEPDLNENKIINLVDEQLFKHWLKENGGMQGVTRSVPNPKQSNDDINELKVLSAYFGQVTETPRLGQFTPFSDISVTDTAFKNNENGGCAVCIIRFNDSGNSFDVLPYKTHDAKLVDAVFKQMNKDRKDNEVLVELIEAAEQRKDTRLEISPLKRVEEQVNA